MDSPKTPDNNSVVEKIKSTRKSYKIEYKLKIIGEYKKTKNYYALSKQTKINISTLIEWVNREYEFTQESNRKNNKRLSGPGRKLIYPADFDSALLAWFNNERENKRAVSYKQLKQEAKKRSGKTITLWWIRGFVRRFNLSIRKITHTKQQTTVDQNKKTELVINYINSLNQLAINYEEMVILNMDETPFWVDSIPKTTLEVAGTQQIDIVTTGHEKERMSIVITCTASGIMLPSLVILKNLKSVPKCAIPRDIFVEVSGIGGSGFMNEHIMIKYINKILIPYLHGRPCLLILDKLKAHKTQMVINHLKRNNIQQFLIEAGFTSELQPIDVSINGPLKRKFRDQWEKWMSESAAVYTRQKGNRKKPQYDISFQMISQAVKSVSDANLIKHSFIACGLYCFHQVQKKEGDNISLTFNDRLKSNFFHIDNVNSKFVLNPNKSIVFPITLTPPPSNSAVHLTTTNDMTTTTTISSSTTKPTSTTPSLITNYFHLIYHSNNNQSVTTDDENEMELHLDDDEEDILELDDDENEEEEELMDAMIEINN